MHAQVSVIIIKLLIVSLMAVAALHFKDWLIL